MRPLLVNIQTNDEWDQSEFETWFECGPSSTNRLFSRLVNKQIRTIPLLVFDRSRVFKLITETVNNKKKKKWTKRRKENGGQMVMFVEK